MQVSFFAPYSQENYGIAKELIKHSNYSYASLFKNENSEQVGNDYTMLTKRGFEENKNIFSLKTTLDSEDCAEIVKRSLELVKVSPDLIVCRGTVEQLWPLAAIKKVTNIEIPIYAILDQVQEEYEKEMLEILNQYDKIFLMDDVCIEGIGKNKQKVLFPGYKASFYPNKMDTESLLKIKCYDNVIILTNDKNYEKIIDDCDKKDILKKVNIISSSGMLDLERSIMMNINNYIFDETEDSFVSLIISKSGKKTRKIEELFKDFEIFMEKEFYMDNDADECIKDFSFYIEKEIINELQNKKCEVKIIKAESVL